MGSIYPEDCLEHMNVGLIVVFVLCFMLLVLGVCVWLAAYEWADRDKSYPYAELADPSFYGETTKYGHRFSVHCVQGPV